jgi:hypothetical protein
MFPSSLIQHVVLIRRTSEQSLVTFKQNNAVRGGGFDGKMLSLRFFNLESDKDIFT